ncbi:MAG: hypothetical protein QG604_951 [Candidatus Dependentiae bacterium]|nr:hypothetical protein [Candidatus Dependentiae bacterium]
MEIGKKLLLIGLAASQLSLASPPDAPEAVQESTGLGMPLAGKAVLGSVVAGGIAYIALEVMLHRMRRPAERATMVTITPEGNRRAFLMRIQEMCQYLIAAGVGIGAILVLKAYLTQSAASQKVVAPSAPLTREEWIVACTAGVSMGQGMSREDAAAYSRMSKAERAEQLLRLAKQKHVGAFIDAATFQGNGTTKELTKIQVNKARLACHPDKVSTYFGERVLNAEDKKVLGDMVILINELGNQADSASGVETDRLERAYDLLSGTFDEVKDKERKQKRS